MSLALMFLATAALDTAIIALGWVIAVRRARRSR